MKKIIVSLAMLALICGSALYAEIGLTVGASVELAGLSSDNDADKITRIAPEIDFAKSFGDLDVDIYAVFDINLAQEEIYWVDYKTGADAEMGKTNMNGRLRETLGYNLGVGSGTITIGLKNDNYFAFFPATKNMPHDPQGIWGELTPSVKYSQSIGDAGDLGVKLGLPITYAHGSKR
jgi:hypothetical protein